MNSCVRGQRAEPAREGAEADSDVVTHGPSRAAPVGERGMDNLSGAGARGGVSSPLVDTAPLIPNNSDMAQRRSLSISDQLRRAIRESQHSMYVIARETEIDPSVLSKFTAGHRGMSLDSIDRVCQFLELEITSRKRKRGK